MKPVVRTLWKRSFTPLPPFGDRLIPVPPIDVDMDIMEIEDGHQLIVSPSELKGMDVSSDGNLYIYLKKWPFE